ncbi:MAG: epoxyqueuosine reductase [Deltaproteobacteria bacterium]|nr:epoxyqueuosine reductase [Deltaproteobacteria bacterium]
MNSPSISELRQSLETFVSAEAARSAHGRWWRTPLLVSAPVDRRFDVLQEIAMDEHFHPRDLLESARSVIVFFIPFVKELIKENHSGERPSRNWGVAYVETNDLINWAGEVIADFLRGAGYASRLTTATHNFDEQRLMARWSHKHLAHMSGLGRFGTHCMLITPSGVCGRFGSLVTEADLGDHPLMHTPEACLLKAGKKCGKCIERCPVNALTKDGFDRRKCWDRLNENRHTLAYYEDLPLSTHVCGKCNTMLPCSFINPVR